MHPSPQTSEFLMEYFLFNSEHSVIICHQCKYALISGEGIKRHFRSLYQAISLQTRKEIIAYCETLQLLPLDEVITPGLNNGPVEGLELVSDGQKCIYLNCTGYFSASESTMEIHCRLMDGRKMIRLFGKSVLCRLSLKEFIENTLKLMWKDNNNLV